MLFNSPHPKGSSNIDNTSTKLSAFINPVPFLSYLFHASLKLYIIAGFINEFSSFTAF
jgi:hypothetical protein